MKEYKKAIKNLLKQRGYTKEEYKPIIKDNIDKIRTFSAKGRPAIFVASAVGRVILKKRRFKKVDEQQYVGKKVEVKPLFSGNGWKGTCIYQTAPQEVLSAAQMVQWFGFEPGETGSRHVISARVPRLVILDDKGHFGIASIHTCKVIPNEQNV